MSRKVHENKTETETKNDDCLLTLPILSNLWNIRLHIDRCLRQLSKGKCINGEIFLDIY